MAVGMTRPCKARKTIPLFPELHPVACKTPIHPAFRTFPQPQLLRGLSGSNQRQRQNLAGEDRSCPDETAAPVHQSTRHATGKAKYRPPFIRQRFRSGDHRQSSAHEGVLRSDIPAMCKATRNVLAREANLARRSAIPTLRRVMFCPRSSSVLRWFAIRPALVRTHDQRFRRKQNRALLTQRKEVMTHHPRWEPAKAQTRARK